MTDLRLVDDVAVSAELPAPGDPMAVARALAGDRFLRGATPTLRHWRGGWWQWQGSHWIEREDRAIRRDAYAFTEVAVYVDDAKVKPWQPTRHKIGNLLEALAAVCHLDETVSQPAWIDGPDRSVVSVANGLLDIGSRVLIPHNPRYFNQTAVPFAFDPEAPDPVVWLDFLDRLWPGDPASIAALQEFVGYVISGRLDLHKILLIVGPTRGGKGTIARIFGKLVGPANVAGPTLSSMSSDFGLAPLLGKSLAVISDARLDAQRDASVVVERLLAISGEDTITVNRKYRDQWTGKLPTRFLVVSNELPRLGDASGTIANRFVVLILDNSWLNREDLTLEDRLTLELPGILNWALTGLDRLAANSRFTRPASTDDAITALQDLASPVAAFVRDECVKGPHETDVKVMFEAWKAWADANGNRAGNQQTFGRNLRSIIPGLRDARPRDGETRLRVYRGVGLRREVPTTMERTADHRGPDPENGPSEASGPQWSAVQRIVDGTPETIPCRDYQAHRFDHRRVGDGFQCPTCHPLPA